MSRGEPAIRYVGFWARVGASLVDWILTALVTLPPLLVIYGRAYFDGNATFKGPADIVISFILPAIAVIEFWRRKQATPGKMLIRSKLVDAETGGKPSTRQLIIRYLGYIPAVLPFGLGLLWVAIDPRKQGWHDKLSNIVVVHDDDPTFAA